MEYPEKELSGIVRTLTETKDYREHEATVNTYFTQDTEFIHPLAHLSSGKDSREALKSIYAVYKVLCFNISVRINSIHYIPNPQTPTKAIIDLTYNSIIVAILYFSEIRLLTILDIKKGVDGKFRISKQWDCCPIDSLSQWKLFGIRINWPYDVALRGAAMLGTFVGGLFRLLGLW